MPFIHEDFLLSTKTAQRLYHEFAEPQPIFDYHCHLPPQDIASNRRFNNLFEIWLEGDHYKWRAMRTNGVAEKFVTGDSDPYDKFLAWAKTVPYTLRNPLYHWTHLELKRYFGITELLNESSAKRIWDQCNEKLKSPELTTQGILKKFNVKVVCTTDDPADDLNHHAAIAKSGLATRVLPTFRPDKALNVHQPEAFNKFVAALGKIAGMEITSLGKFVDAITVRHDAFHEMGGRISDHGMDQCFADFCEHDTAAGIYDRARKGQAAGSAEFAQFATYMMLVFGRLDAKRGWTKQLHLGALRNNNARLLGKLGPDTGFDSMGDRPQAAPLSAYMDKLDQENLLPKTIIYNNNPKDNYTFATMIGNFQDGSVPGKVQFGSAWWFVDQKEGMEWQMNALSNIGLLSRFVGMVTDSRSFMSYPRHEYFRRTLCNLVGRDVEAGEIPNDDSLLAPLIRNVCYGNARDFFGIAVS
jgi:glucuronate isomerase